MLFDPDVEMSREPKALDESFIDFIGRSGKPGWGHVRARLEDWVSLYPEGNAAEFRGRLTKRASEPFWGAYWELYLYHLLRAHGGDATCHPEVPGTSDRPDFIVSGLGDEPFYLEAKALMEQKDFEYGARLGSRLVQGINDRVTSQMFGVAVAVETVGPAELSVRKAANAVQRWLSTLDPLKVAENAHLSGTAYHPDILRWPVEQASKISGWRLSFTPFVKSGRAPSDDVLLAARSPDAVLMTDDKDLYRAIERKTEKYGESPQRPLVLAVLAGRPSLDEAAIRSALFGVDDHADGIWSRSGKPRGQKLSAVIIAKRVRFDSVASAQFEMWINPWAYRPCSLRFDNADLVEMKNSRLVRTSARSSNHEVFGLTAGWPVG